MERDDHALDQVFMKRAFELAVRGLGSVSPNPLVGAVIVHQNKIIGEGWHREYGKHHAEVNAVDSVKDSSLLSESTIYVSLEPCNHTGQTPPCTDLLIKSRFKKVVIANNDPNPVASGGIQRLKDAGIEVDVGVSEDFGIEVNKRFFTYIGKRRPYIILKWAETKDRFIARANYESKWISNELSRQLVHKWRSEEDAVLVGTNTALHDNPRLNVRDWEGRNPVRIVIDRQLKLKNTLHLFDKSQKTIVYNVLKDEKSENLEYRKLSEDNFLMTMLTDLYNEKIQSVIVEGGTQTLQHFIDTKNWDEIRLFKSDQLFSNGIAAPDFEGNLFHSESVLNDTLTIYKPQS